AQPLAMEVHKVDAPEQRYTLLDDGLRLESGISIGHATERRHRPHKWLSHTVRHLDLQLEHSGAGLGFGFDVKKRHATFSIGRALLGFGLDTRVKFHKGKATFFATLDLHSASRNYKIRLPEFSLVPKSYKGRRYVEYQVPIVRGNLDDVVQAFLDPASLINRLRFF
ncbi:MAG: hypothetical protein KJO07_20105, partial [Deltaproteobacteria bacterium]|nr:hypothetical protein [Deltaproteobacteria bacterium]